MTAGTSSLSQRLRRSVRSRRRSAAEEIRRYLIHLRRDRTFPTDLPDANRTDPRQGTCQPDRIAHSERCGQSESLRLDCASAQSSRAWKRGPTAGSRPCRREPALRQLIVATALQPRRCEQSSLDGGPCPFAGLTTCMRSGGAGGPRLRAVLGAGSPMVPDLRFLRTAEGLGRST